VLDVGRFALDTAAAEIAQLVGDITADGSR
jgi:hypothetical protein